MGELEQEIRCIEKVVNCAELFSIMNSLRQCGILDPDVTSKVTAKVIGVSIEYFSTWMSNCRFHQVGCSVVLDFDI